MPVKMSVDISEQAAGMGALPGGATLLSTVEMRDWNLSPQWTDEDFRFVPPAGAKLAESLMEGIGAGGAQEHLSTQYFRNIVVINKHLQCTYVLSAPPIIGTYTFYVL